MMLFMNIYMKAMKNNLSNTTIKVHHYSISILFIIVALVFNNCANAQGTKDSTTKLSFNMNLGPVISDGVRTMKVSITRKENKKTIHVNDLRSPLNLYLSQVEDHDAATGTGWMSKAYADSEGEAILTFPSWFRQFADTVHEYTFIVKMAADPKYEDAEEQITIADARIVLEYSGEDSVKTAGGQISGWKEKEYVPVAGSELKLGIKRTFNYLPFTEAGATTNEEGKISGELPLDLPGNADKTITLVARLEDDATYGTVEITKAVPWSILPKLNPVRGRTLWSPGGNAPWLLVISSVSIILIIWGTIFYLISLLFKIKKLGKAS
jgi:hypothetical protein